MKKIKQVMSDFREILNKIVLLNKPKMEEGLKGYTSSEIHCIEYIGKNADSNVTKLADFFYMTRGAISKLSKKLIHKGVIESYQQAENKKEVYFRLTEKGEVIHKIHQDLHKEFRKRDNAVFGQVTEEQFDSMLHFVKMYNEHLNEEIEKQGIGTN